MKETKNDLRGVTELNKIINDFVKPFDCTASFSLDFAYYYTNNNITYSLVTTPKANHFFKKNLIDNYKFYMVKDDVDMFIFSLLHELGHHHTMDDISNTKWKVLKFKHWLIEKLYRLTNANYIYNKYFTLEDEWLATKWACNYWKTHINDIKKLKKVLILAIQEFYSKNQIFLNPNAVEE